VLAHGNIPERQSTAGTGRQGKMETMVAVARFGDEFLSIEGCPSGLSNRTAKDQLQDAAMGRPFTVPCPAADMAALRNVVYLQPK
jgi:hypothetical protein